MALIQINSLNFSYEGGEEIFSSLSLQIDTGWKLGLIGRNGRGKTTFLRLLMNSLSYDGRIISPLEFDYFPFAVADISRPGREIIAEISPDAEEWQVSREIGLLGMGEEILDRPFETLSGGERTKILLAALFLREDCFLLIDEPTNHLDLEGRELLGEYLKRKKGFILVSHDRTLLDSCIDHVLSINRSGIDLLKGNFSTWRQDRENRDRHELAENRKLQKDIKRLRDSAKRSAEWSKDAEKEKYGNGPVDRGFIGAKAERMMQRAKSTESRRQKAVEEKSHLLKNREIEDKLSISPEKFHSKRYLELENVSIRYDESLAPLFENLSFSLEAGECVALAGKNGCGKSSLLKLIARQNIPHSGRVFTPQALQISYVPQDASFLKGTLSEFVGAKGIEETLFMTILRKFGFPREQFELEMGDFSAGQKKKVLLAGSLAKRAHLYLWDEPLNYIDVISRIQIEELLKEHRPTLLLVEHDKAFLDAVTERTIWL